MNDYKGWDKGFENFRERAKVDMRNLHDLIRWLEYGKTSGCEAARCSVKQEEHWAEELKLLLSMDGIIIRFEHPESEFVWYKYFTSWEEVYKYFEESNHDGMLNYDVIQATVPELEGK